MKFHFQLIVIIFRKSYNFLIILLSVLFLIALTCNNIFIEYGHTTRNQQKPNRIPWFFKNGNVYPNESTFIAKLWPEENPDSDRIQEQLMFTIPQVSLAQPEKLKKILIYDWGDFEVETGILNGQYIFIKDQCPVQSCEITGKHSKINEVDLVVVTSRTTAKLLRRRRSRPPNQLWMLFVLESPFHSGIPISNQFNFTATYRRDSDVVTPYGKWAYYDEDIRSIPSDINYAAGKTKKVAWFVSNCEAQNNRLRYAETLQKYISVDIYGDCGDHKCPRNHENKCFQKLSREYKFYLAFENSNCRDYITEKFFINGLQNNILPIVMGAHPDDYKAVAPHNSYIHVESFQSPQKLAEYLHYLDANDEAYNEYFKWKGTGEFINHRSYCRMCIMLHYFELYNSKTSQQRSVQNLKNWWNGPEICLRDSPWRWTNQTV